MKKKLEGVAALITGASSGLGRAMARALLEEGARVALASRPGNKLLETTKEFTDAGLSAVSLPMDVRDEDSVESAASWVKEHWEHLDLVINNAGLGMVTVNPEYLTNPKPFFLVPPEKFTAMIDTNLMGYFLVSQAFARLFVQQGHGRFVNITISLSSMKRRGFFPIGPARAATESLSYIMAEDLKPYGITVNLLAPGGAVDSGMVPEGVRADEEQRRMLLPPEVVAEPIVFLASKEAEGLTGERIVAKEWKDWIASFRASRSARRD